MIYPTWDKSANIGVTAPSSGVSPELHDMMKLAIRRMEEKGFSLTVGPTVWTQHKAKSAPASTRANEFNEMMADDRIGLIFPPWGGELLIEMLENVRFEDIRPKWILGYSDLSVLLLAVTLTTGIATAHGTNLIDLRGDYSDETSAKWQAALSTRQGESVTQYSSPLYQKEWTHDTPSPCVFHLQEPTEWRVVGNRAVTMQGRVLAGCIDVVRHLIGTPYGDVQRFRRQFAHDEPIVWVLENCEISTVDLRRSLVQMKLAGWFDDCSGILFGRSSANRPVDGYTVEDVYEELSEELRIPIVYDIDCGHVPPQMTFVNGAYAEIEVAEGKGTVKQTFLP
ncbi:LD-carboxypeptidase [Cohnella endophytica]|uniref:LD-carboxypeptidase n=1 Tax=Cohnella endophytica TaxID=2419778 RepID=A0A494X8Z9_9BACL|nr:S66 peptidase family protein [Cohnella endophytica]RKP47197.1 LD-carboxypeptidase [Cohnella endophytica]